ALGYWLLPLPPAVASIPPAAPASHLLAAWLPSRLSANSLASRGDTFAAGRANIDIASGRPAHLGAIALVSDAARHTSPESHTWPKSRPPASPPPPNAALPSSATARLRRGPA